MLALLAQLGKIAALIESLGQKGPTHDGVPRYGGLKILGPGGQHHAHLTCAIGGNHRRLLLHLKQSAGWREARGLRRCWRIGQGCALRAEGEQSAQ